MNFGAEITVLQTKLRNLGNYRSHNELIVTYDDHVLSVYTVGRWSPQGIYGCL